MKNFHLKDFPDDRIRILFKDNTKFLNESIRFFGSNKKLAKYLSVTPQTIISWKKLNLFISLAHIKKIAIARKLGWDYIENNVLMYKGPNTSYPVKKPKLPIAESPELFAIISHMAGDGSVNKNGIPIYTNSNKKLINNLDGLIKKVFGSVNSKIYKSNSGAYQYRFSRVVTDLLTYFYRIKFNSKSTRLPSKILKMPKRYSYEVIRAFVDDEGHISSNRITIKLANKALLSQIRYLMVKALGKNSVTNVISGYDRFFYFSVRSKYLKKFALNIKLKHITKNENLNYSIKRIDYRIINPRGLVWESKYNILKILNNGKRNLEYISRRLLMNRSNALTHIKFLEKQSYIGRLKQNDLYFYITKKGKFAYSKGIQNIIIGGIER